VSIPDKDGWLLFTQSCCCVFQLLWHSPLRDSLWVTAAKGQQSVSRFCN
jgi:hypothetical protein